MKKTKSALFILLVILVLLSSCTSPFSRKKIEPFEKGFTVGGTYLNFQANIKFSIPLGWTDQTSEFSSFLISESNSTSFFSNVTYENNRIDLYVSNRETNANIMILSTVAGKINPKNFDASIDKEYENTKRFHTEHGLSLREIDQFSQLIAGREFRVDVVELSFEGITAYQYRCVCLIDSYLYSIAFTLPPASDGDESFEQLITRFSAIE